MAIELHKGDLPDATSFGAAVAVDTEAMGLNPRRDRLCLVQLSAGDGDCHIVQMKDGEYQAPNLRALLADAAVTKIFHFARFDMALLKRYLRIMPAPVFCTKIASKLSRTYTEKHSLKDLCKEILNVDLSKQQQSSDWGAETLTQAQLEYAACDVLYLHQLRQHLDGMLEREGRSALARQCFEFLATRAELDLSGWSEIDIFHH